MKVPRTRAYRFKRYDHWRLRATKPEENSEPLISRAETVAWLHSHVADMRQDSIVRRTVELVAEALEEGEGFYLYEKEPIEEREPSPGGDFFYAKCLICGIEYRGDTCLADVIACMESHENA